MKQLDAVRLCTLCKLEFKLCKMFEIPSTCFFRHLKDKVKVCDKEYK